jgi:hypothetical protein
MFTISREILIRFYQLQRRILMAVLSEVDRQDEFAEIMRVLSADRTPCSVTKDVLRAAVDAADGWADANTASYYASLPLTLRTWLNGQSALFRTAFASRLLMYVIERRYKVGA